VRARGTAIVAGAGLMLSLLACTSKPAVSPKPSASPTGSQAFPQRTPDARTVLLQFGDARGGSSGSASLDATSTIFLQGACIGTGTVSITVKVAAKGAHPGFSSTFPFTCEPRERTTSFPLGRFVKGTKLRVSDDGSNGSGSYWAEIERS
jgi:hypothetical protein